MSGPHPATPTDWSHGRWHRIHPCIIKNVDNQNVAFCCQCLFRQTTQIINPKSDFFLLFWDFADHCFDAINKTANHMISFSHVLFICPLVSHMVMQPNIKVRTSAITEKDMAEGALLGVLLKGPSVVWCSHILYLPPLPLATFMITRFTFDLPTSEDASVGASERVKCSQQIVMWSPGGESFQKTETHRGKITQLTDQTL